MISSCVSLKNGCRWKMSGVRNSSASCPVMYLNNVLKLCCWKITSVRDRISSLTCLCPLENPLIPNFSFVHYMIPPFFFCYRIFREGTVLKRKYRGRGQNSQALISAVVTEAAVLEDNKNMSETSPSMLLCTLAFCWTQTNERPWESHPKYFTDFGHGYLKSYFNSS